MYNEYLWEPEYCYSFYAFVNRLTFFALVAAFFHSFDGCKIVQTILNAIDPVRQRHRNVHKIIERITRMSTLCTFYFTTQLPLEKIGDNRIVSFSKIPVPYLRLLTNRFPITVYLLVPWFLSYSVQFVVHTV